MILLMRSSWTPSAIVLQNEYGKEMAPNDGLLCRDVCIPYSSSQKQFLAIDDNKTETNKDNMQKITDFKAINCQGSGIYVEEKVRRL